MFRLELLPAVEGDCLILSWGNDAAPRRILIDAGRKQTARTILKYASDNKLPTGAFERFIITHIDRDHIEGAVPLLRNAGFRKCVKQVWFNGRGDLDYAEPQSSFESMGALDGERITSAISKFAIPWNTDFEGAPVAVSQEKLPSFCLPEGLAITVLSPDLNQLASLAETWDDTVDAAPEGWENLGATDQVEIEPLAASSFKSDRAKPNATSIAIIAEYEEKRLFLAGDAHVGRLMASLDLYRARHPEKREFVLVKAPHHGSRGNISKELVAKLNCNKWAISTNGNQFRHPDKEAIARIIAYSPQGTMMWFNYRTRETELWSCPLVPDRGFKPIYGLNGYVSINLEK